MSKIAIGKVLIKGNSRLAKQVQQKLINRGYRWQDGSETIREAVAPDGSKMWGIGFKTEGRYTTVKGKAVYQKFKFMYWTSRPRVFKYYPGRIISPDLMPIGGIKRRVRDDKPKAKPVKKRNPELIEMV